METQEEKPDSGAADLKDGIVLTRDASGRQLLASCTPSAGAPPLDAAALAARIAACGCADWRQDADAQALFIRQHNAGGTVAALALAECRDGALTVHLSDDKMTARLDIVPAEGGKPVDETDIYAALAAQGITTGYLEAAIAAAVATQEAHGVEVARGQPPEPGQDGFLENLLPGVRERQPRLTESGRIDYRDMGEIFTVDPETPLMCRRRATPGIPGATLLGQIIPPRPGKEAMFAPHLEGVAASPENPDLLVATLTGQPVPVKDGIMVEPVITLPAVNMASGHIDFDGSVVVKGDVGPGMRIRARGDIEVGGVVENAQLEAGGSILIKGGALGSIDQPGGQTAVLRCGKNFQATYAQKVRIEAGDTLFLADMAMQCELTAGQHIKIGKGKRGHLIGGQATAMRSIVAHVIGAPNRITTLCRIGIAPEVQKRLEAARTARDAAENQLLEVSKLLDFAQRNPGRLTPEMFAKARQTAAALNETILARRAEENELAAQVAVAQEAFVQAEQALYEGVEVHFGTQIYRVVGEHGAGQIRMGTKQLELVG